MPTVHRWVSEHAVTPLGTKGGEDGQMHRKGKSLFFIISFIRQIFTERH